MKIAITGARGQLGRELARVLQSHHHIIPLARPEYDIADARSVDAIAHLAPDLILHAAALTDVDRCAREPERAMQINAFGTRNVAQGCARAGAAMLYISTNEVFDGAQDSAYLESDAPHPINAYGASKLAGENFARATLPQVYIVRTAWLYARGGNKFPDKIIAAAKAHSRAPLRVVDDEFGNPTYAPDLARAIAQLIETRAYGVYHFVNEGVASRYDWACRVLERAGFAQIPIARTKLADYSRDSTPPRNGALANCNAKALGIKLRHWEDALEDYFTAENAEGAEKNPKSEI